MAATTARRGNSRRTNATPAGTASQAGQASKAGPASPTGTASKTGPASKAGKASKAGPASPAGTAPPAGTASPADQPAADSLTIGAVPRNVARARAFVAKVLGPDHRCAETAVLLCSELVTNAVLHSHSARSGGKITVTVADLTASVHVKVVDEGSASSIPVVKAKSLAADGHGLFLVENLADQWGYESDDTSTTVWFRVTS